MAGLNSSKSRQLHVQAMQSIIPGKIAEPGQSRRIRIPEGPLRSEALRSHFRMVFYYKAGDHDQDHESVASVAAWTKETMSSVLSEHPVLAGRLRRDREDEGFWEVKFNDAGVRMLQATAEVSMAEFLKQEEEVEAREGVLAYWMDVDLDHPEVSALCYLQVTEFQGDGYSIGISCSLLLADPLFFSQFLKKWAVVHTNMMAQARPEVPIFHLGYFTRPNKTNYLRSFPLDSGPTKPISKSVLFKAPWASDINYKSLASLCIKEAKHRLEKTIMPFPKFSMIINDPAGGLTVDSMEEEEVQRGDELMDRSGLRVMSMEEFGLDELALSEGNKPLRVSHHFMSDEHEGLLLVMLPAHEDGHSEMLISVTVPNKIC